MAVSWIVHRSKVGILPFCIVVSISTPPSPNWIHHWWIISSFLFRTIIELWALIWFAVLHVSVKTVEFCDWIDNVEDSCLFLIENKVLLLCLSYIYKWGLEPLASIRIARFLLACALHPCHYESFVRFGGIALLLVLLQSSQLITEVLLVVSILVRYGFWLLGWIRNRSGDTSFISSNREDKGGCETNRVSGCLFRKSFRVVTCLFPTNTSKQSHTYPPYP